MVSSEGTGACEISVESLLNPQTQLCSVAQVSGTHRSPPLGCTVLLTMAQAPQKLVSCQLKDSQSVAHWDFSGSGNEQASL